MKKENKKKFRDIRNALAMMCVMVAMLSTASYAWFTLTDSPTVVGMQMTAASTGGLQVSNDSTSGFADAITIRDTETKILKPVTPDLISPGSFKSGVYAGNTVVGTSALSNLTDYVAVYEYYLKSTAVENASKTINIGIICGDRTTQSGTMGVTGQVADLGGSIVRQKDNGNAAGDLSYAIRVGLVPEGSSEMYIWEPNTDGTITTKTMATDNTGITLEPHVGSTMAGNITTGSVGASSVATTSKGLFTMTEGETKKITMYIWLEGTDSECANEIQANEIEAQIQFTIVDDATSSTP